MDCHFTLQDHRRPRLYPDATIIRYCRANKGPVLPFHLARNILGGGAGRAGGRQPQKTVATVAFGVVELLGPICYIFGVTCQAVCRAGAAVTRASNKDRLQAAPQKTALVAVFAIIRLQSCKRRGAFWHFLHLCRSTHAHVQQHRQVATYAMPLNPKA